MKVNIQQIQQNLIKDVKKRIPKFRVGDTVRVHYRIQEAGKERVQTFEGIVIADKHGGISRTFTVRKISYGIGVERIFPLYSPNIVKIEILTSGKVRRSKLYYLRVRKGTKASKLKSDNKKLLEVQEQLSSLDEGSKKVEDTVENDSEKKE